MSFEKILGFVLLVVFPIFQLGCYGILHGQKGDIVIRKRNVTMIYISTIAAWLAYINLIVSLFGGLPCAVYNICTIVISPLSIGIQLLRGIRLWGMLERNKILSSSFGSNNNNTYLNVDVDNPPLTVIHEVDSSKGEISQISDIHMHVRKDSNVYESLMNVKVRVTRLIGFVRLFLITLPLVLILALLVMTDSKILGARSFLVCFPEPILIQNSRRIFMAILSISAFCTTIFMGRCYDALGIRMEIMRNIMILFVTNVISFLMSHNNLVYWNILIILIQQMLLSLSMIAVPYFNNASVVKWMKSTSKRLVTGYARPIPQIKTSRGSILLPGKKMSQIDASENSQREREATMSLDAGLCILLSSNEGIEQFTEHCSREFSVENVKFWLEVNEFHKAVDSLQDDEKNNCHNQKDLLTFAKDIYSTFVMEGSDMQINISEAQMISIKQKLESEESIKRDLFDVAQREIYSLMSRHSYPRFLSSCPSKRDGKYSRRTSTVLPT